MQLHLLSSPGEPFLRDVLLIARQVLEGVDEPVVVYLPAANVERHFIRETKALFRDIARVVMIKAEGDPLPKAQSVLKQADLIYIPGGNTYLLAQRLHAARLMGPIKERLLGGLPLVAFSAGTVLCGEDILTTNDINCCGCTQFAGLGLVDVNFNVHYPPVEGIERQERDSRLMEYQAFHDIPVIALEDGAYLLANEDGIQLIRGNGWLLKKGKPKTILSPQE